MLNVDYKNCTGCGACVQKCPRNCISLKQNDSGFLYPTVDNIKCINCGLCDKVCPIHHYNNKESLGHVYAVKSKYENECIEATSGGFFGIVANYVIENGGVVFGSIMDDKLQVKHISVDVKEKLIQLKGSKYVQSSTLDTYKECKSKLENGMLVLYSGTPCQIAGLKVFLGKEYSNLITADVICHGVPSQAYFDKYICGLEKREGGSIVAYDFRSKLTDGWSLAGIYKIKRNNVIENKKLYYSDNYYYYYFLQGSIYRESCYHCQYANTHRVGDFTLGDFWGVESIDVEFDTEYGCSLVILNTQKALELFSKLDMYNKEVTLEDALKHNAQLNEPAIMPESREERLKEFRDLSAEDIHKKFLKQQKKKIFIARLKYKVPYSIRKKLLQIRYKCR